MKLCINKNIERRNSDIKWIIGETTWNPENKEQTETKQGKAHSRDPITKTAYRAAAIACWMLDSRLYINPLQN